MADLEERTMHVFIQRALKKILKEAPKKHVQLRQSCAAVIGALLRSGAQLAARASTRLAL